jgi:hypothetical protein
MAESYPPTPTPERAEALKELGALVDAAVASEKADYNASRRADYRRWLALFASPAEANADRRAAYRRRKALFTAPVDQPETPDL